MIKNEWSASLIYKGNPSTQIVQKVKIHVYKWGRPLNLPLQI
jgi:hypothetical protein